MPSLPPILLVDDDPDDIFILKRLLLKGGVDNKVIAFEDALAAREYLEAENEKAGSIYMPCIVMTDLQMPGMTGIELVEWIRSQPSLATLPVVVTSSSEDPAHKARALAAGATIFLAKYPTASVLRKLTNECGCNKLGS